MQEEWDDVFTRPDVAGLLKLAEHRYTGTGPEGAAVVVDVAGTIVEVSVGESELPATAGTDIMTAANRALDAWEAETNRFAKEQGLFPEEDSDEASSADAGERPSSFRKESGEGAVVVTVDANSMRISDLYLENLSETTLSAIAPTAARAFGEARGGGEVTELEDNLRAAMDQLTESLQGMQTELDAINDRLRQAEQDLPVKE